MSINVTVSGNPVRFSHGKMVISDPARIEFEKRRLIRLEQVRQQSKDIAENLRNKLKKEKSKCLSEIEKEGEVKLKSWQAKKLLELQNQYQAAIEEIGLGQRSAAEIVGEEELLDGKKISSEMIAKERGRTAMDRVQVEKNEENLKKAVPVQRKKLIRDMENSRSNTVSNLKKSNKKKKNSQLFNKDDDNRIPQLIGLDSDSESSGLEPVSKSTKALKKCKDQQTSPIDFQVPTSDKALQTIVFQQLPIETPKNFPLDTRISERIKLRNKFDHQVDYCDFIEKEQRGILCDCCKCLVKFGQNQESVDLGDESKKSLHHLPINKTSQTKVNDSQKTDQNKKIDQQQFDGNMRTTDQDLIIASQNVNETIGTEEKKSEKTVPQKAELKLNTRGTKSSQKGVGTVEPKNKSIIPLKPKVTLKSVKDRPAYIGTNSKLQPVQFYDHPNRYSKSYIPKSSLIDKIDDDELRISPNILSEEEVKEKMRQRDIQAHIRGQVALEKEKLQREYKELLRKLPVLQKQERICEIGMDKEEYHMNRDRLEDVEKKRQNRLDNAYEELFVRKRPTVTLPRKKEERDDFQSLNLANWDTDFYAPDPSRSRTEQLTDLLTNLKSQKDSLLREIENTLSKENFSYIANNKTDVDDLKSKSTDYTRIKTKRKRSRDEGPLSPVPSSSRKDATTTSSGRTSSPSPRKKPKLKTSKKVVVLQNTSTQTTPKTEQHSVATSPLFNTPVEKSETCTCSKTIDDLCEIVIKIKDDEKPEVLVNPPFLGNSIKVIAEDLSKDKDTTSTSTGEKEKRLPKQIDKPKKKPFKEIVEVKKKTSKPVDSSWGEHLSNTVSSKSESTSTSYRDLPKRAVSEKTSTELDPRDSSTISTDSTAHPLDPRLLTYIKKLLNMSRASIEDLTVSAASDVSTPTPSLIETPSNNPLYQLRNVMKYFNIDAAELQKQLSYSADESSKHYNTSESVTVSSSSDGEKSVQFKSCLDVDPKRVDSERVLKQYADVTASCSKKISDLTAMIEKVREEKKKMLMSSTSSSSEKDLTTTSYKDLPDSQAKRKSPTQEELENQLLNVDYSYAERLKRLSKDEIEVEKKRAEDVFTDSELLTRLRDLFDGKKENDRTTVAAVTQKELVRDSGGQPVAITSEKRLIRESKDGKTVGASTIRTRISLKPKEEQSPPIFLDIPKLPKLEAPSLDKKKKKPPPSKGLRGITGNVPHELSTIVEADSQLSTKIESPKAKRFGANGDVPYILTEAQKKEKTQSSTGTNSDDISEMETMETMLMSIGMEWAIPTLKKTRQALALSSSSSGDLSLREFLSKISSSTSRSEEASLSESQGVSLIHVDNRRTSTPIVDYKGKKEGPIFMTDSDLSSVKEHSSRKDSEKFFDLNENTLTKSG